MKMTFVPVRILTNSAASINADCNVQLMVHTVVLSFWNCTSLVTKNVSWCGSMNKQTNNKRNCSWIVVVVVVILLSWLRWKASLSENCSQFIAMDIVTNTVAHNLGIAYILKFSYFHKRVTPDKSLAYTSVALLTWQIFKESAWIRTGNVHCSHK